MKNNASLFFLGKTFTTPFPGYMRGVEVFNLALLRELIELGCNVYVCIHRSWTEIMQKLSQNTPQGKLEYVSIHPGPFGTLLLLLSKRFHFSVLLLDNVGNRFIPVLFIVRLFNIAKRCVVIAHRRPSWKFIYSLKILPTTIVAVNRIIANDFRAGGLPDVDVYYGIINADRFHPPQNRDTTSNRQINFCVLGYLDNAWKGMDTAVSAFRALPEQIKNNSTLHLASFTNPPTFPEKNIQTYTWMSPDDIPAFLRKMDVMLVPSRDEMIMRETFSQAMVQGMLTGLPVVVNNLPVLTEKIDCGGGMVFNNIRELTEIMSVLVENPELRNRLGRVAREVALKRYVWNTKFFMEHYLFPSDSINIYDLKRQTEK